MYDIDFGRSLDDGSGEIIQFDGVDIEPTISRKQFHDYVRAFKLVDFYTKEDEEKFHAAWCRLYTGPRTGVTLGSNGLPNLHVGIFKVTTTSYYISRVPDGEVMTLRISSIIRATSASRTLPDTRDSEVLAACATAQSRRLYALCDLIRRVEYRAVPVHVGVRTLYDYEEQVPITLPDILAAYAKRYLGVRHDCSYRRCDAEADLYASDLAIQCIPNARGALTAAWAEYYLTKFSVPHLKSWTASTKVDAALQHALVHGVPRRYSKYVESVMYGSRDLDAVEDLEDDYSKSAWGVYV